MSMGLIKTEKFLEIAELMNNASSVQEKIYRAPSAAVTGSRHA